MVSPANGSAPTAASGDGVHSIDVRWISGVVEIVNGEGDDIVFKETQSAHYQRHGGGEEMDWLVENGVLYINYTKDKARNWTKSGFLFEFLVYDNRKGKHLTISLPRGIKLECLKINSTNAEVSITEGEWSADKIRINTTNSKIRLEAPQGREIKLSTTNGKIVLSLPEETTGFTAVYTKVHGALHCDFPVVITGGTLTYGDGGGQQISISTVNGGISILKLQP